jgi:hypothetical protein|tara:strand:- start:2430 stop:2609 length:180 start_codon:yes stop_codon:yes gene_type:complete
MTKYKNKDGIELSYDGHENDYHANLVKEVVREGLKLLEENFLSGDVKKCKEFFEVNFSL